MQDKTEMSDCKPCPTGEYTEQWGQEFCKVCTGNVTSDRTVCNTGGNVTCPPGQYFILIQDSKSLSNILLN